MVFKDNLALNSFSNNEKISQYCDFERKNAIIIWQRGLMFKIEFYEDRNGYSELREQLRQLAINSKKNKNERIQNNKIWFFIELLNQKGYILT